MSGIYQEGHELQELLPHLSRVLGFRAQFTKQDGACSDLIDAKLRACQIIDQILDFRLNLRITKLLQVLKVNGSHCVAREGGVRK